MVLVQAGWLFLKGDYKRPLYMPMKMVATFICAACITMISYAGEQSIPSLLRVDLLQHPDVVYNHGLKTNLTLEQAVLAGDRFQYCQVNSRYPLFSWVVPMGYQAAYQILVASRKELLLADSADVWNSGQNKGNNSIHVLYTGPALRPYTIYYWKVRTWGIDGRRHGFSAIQAFCTGKVLTDASLPSFALVKTHQFPEHVQQKAESILYDFGKDGFGQLRLWVNTRNANDTLIVHLGEKLTADGHVDREPPGTVRYRMMKVPLLPGNHTYQPLILPDKRNTGSKAILMPAAIGEVLPFRYVEIAVANEQYTIDTVSRYLVTSVFNDSASSFTSSDTALNRLWDFCKYTVKATSFTGYYVDGDRERIPYEADALINQLSHYACDAEFTMAKRTLDYLIYHPTWPTEWSLQNILIAWNDYLYTGDLRQARKLYPELKAKLLAGLAREDGLISTRTGKQTPEFLKQIHFQPFNANNGLKDIVDWPPAGGIGGKQTGVMGETDGFVFTDYNAVVNAWYYAGLETMEKLSAALGYATEAVDYHKEAARVRTAFHRTFFDAQTNLVTDGEGTKHSSLHANFFALAFGLISRQQSAPVLAFIHSRGMACSVYGAQFLLDALYKVNDQAYAQQLLTSMEKRSWFNMLREGASMTMESWGQEYKPNQDWNHAWGTAPANVLVRYLAGVQPLTPGYGVVQIKPQPGTVEQVALQYTTIRGKISVRFENKTDRFLLEVHLPGNTPGRVCLPFATPHATVTMNGKKVKAWFAEGYYEVRNVPPGKHVFTVYAGNQR